MQRFELRKIKAELLIMLTLILVIILLITCRVYIIISAHTCYLAAKYYSCRLRPISYLRSNQSFDCRTYSTKKIKNKIKCILIYLHSARLLLAYILQSFLPNFLNTYKYWKNTYSFTKSPIYNAGHAPNKVCNNTSYFLGTNLNF